MNSKLIVGLVAVLILAIVVPAFYMGYALKSRPTPLMSTVGSLQMLQAADNAAKTAGAPEEPSEPVADDRKAAAQADQTPARTVFTTYAAQAQAALAPAIAAAQSHSEVVPTTQAP